MGAAVMMPHNCIHQIRFVSVRVFRPIHFCYCMTPSVSRLVIIWGNSPAPYQVSFFSAFQMCLCQTSDIIQNMANCLSGIWFWNFWKPFSLFPVVVNCPSWSGCMAVGLSLGPGRCIRDTPSHFMVTSSLSTSTTESAHSAFCLQVCIHLFVLSTWRFRQWWSASSNVGCFVKCLDEVGCHFPLHYML